jgi:hypothetical protein
MPVPSWSHGCNSPLVTPVSVGRHRKQHRQVDPGGPVLRHPGRARRRAAVRHERIGGRLRHLPGRPGPVARQHQLLRTPEVAEKARRGGMKDIAQNGRTGCCLRGDPGRRVVIAHAAVHHAGDLDPGRVPPRGLRCRAHGPGGLPGLGRAHQVEDDAVRDPAGQLEHPRAQRGQEHRQLGPDRRAVQRHRPGAEDRPVVAGLAGQHGPDHAHVLGHHGHRGEWRETEPAVHHLVADPQAEDQPPARGVVELGRELGCQHRRAQRRVRDGGADPRAVGGGGHRMAQRQGVAVPLGHEHRAEAGPLGRLGQRAHGRRWQAAV